MASASLRLLGQQRAFAVLPRSPVLDRHTHPQLWPLVRVHRVKLGEWFVQRLGDRLAMTASAARLFRLPVDGTFVVPSFARWPGGFSSWSSSPWRLLRTPRTSPPIRACPTGSAGSPCLRALRSRPMTPTGSPSERFRQVCPARPPRAGGTPGREPLATWQTSSRAPGAD
ncbi:DUF2398 family protein [Amycolatopsis rhizosphaerae]|uniref:DUF2398 family protein n=1 Tax=Amycolatopsis rhizosphaerae TaxID=2053003 RepID=A0A558DGG0_9PSEU|nr:DUF2398 family protein [Amycolatopsis rhizosphaerae]